MSDDLKGQYDFSKAERGRFFRPGALLVPPQLPRSEFGSRLPKGNINGTFMSEIAIRSFVEAGGRVPFQVWLDALDRRAQAKIDIALYRLGKGNRAQVKGVGGGVAELKVDFGPGYRIYFGQDGEVLVILLAGGTKKRQSEDIMTAKARWAEYKARKTLHRN